MPSATLPRSRRTQKLSQPRALPELEVGDRLDQATFHARYEAMPTEQKFELIGGTVYMSPMKADHGEHTWLLVPWLAEYQAETPGTCGLDNTSNILGEEDEPQPDACLVIAPEKGGATRLESGWLVGPPELVAEVASSSESYDLHQKKETYEKFGVREYLVLAIRPKRVFWFIARAGRFEELLPDADGIIRSERFPGLWLDPQALMNKDHRRLHEVRRQGLASPEHAAFVAKLAKAKPGRGKRK